MKWVTLTSTRVRAVGDDLAVTHDDDAVGPRVGLLEVVGGEQDRAAARGVRVDGLPEGPGGR